LSKLLSANGNSCFVRVGRNCHWVGSVGG